MSTEPLNPRVLYLQRTVLHGQRTILEGLFIQLEWQFEEHCRQMHPESDQRYYVRHQVYTTNRESYGAMNWICPVCHWIYRLAETLNSILDMVDRDLHIVYGTEPRFSGRSLNRIFIDPEQYPFPPSIVIPVGSSII